MIPTVARPLTPESVKFGAGAKRVTFVCDARLAETVQSLAIEEKHDSVSRVIRRLLRVGAEAEGIRVYDE